MATMYDPYKNNANITERRETAPKPQTSETPVKNTLDNSGSVLYNKDREKSGFKPPSLLTDTLQRWKEKNKGTLRYAGDSAKKSIDAGLKEAPYFMQDAYEGTSFDKVQDTAVKWRLAVDAQNDDLYQRARNEMIGHLSKENKEPYLKDAQPLQKYIDAKDEFDYKHNNYTTTENVYTTPDEAVRNLQRELNEKGYTDKFGDKLKEDGIYAGKTAYAFDTFNADGSKTNSYANSTIADPKDYGVLALNANGEPFESPSFVSAGGPMLDPQVIADWQNGDNVKVASVTGTGGKGVLESVDPKGNVRKYNEKIKENANMNGKPEWNIRRASNIISKNSEAIKSAGKKYGVNPAIIAACIYTEQIVNYNVGDVVADKLYWKNPSVGIGQVQIATAQSIEDKGLIEKTKYLGKMQDWHANGYVEKDAWQIPGYGIFLGTKEEAIAKRLNIDEQCIEYVGAYLKLIQDLWKDAYPIIDGKSDILATLYNMGEYGGSRGINSSPKPSPFGNTAKANYYHMQYLLGIE